MPRTRCWFGVVAVVMVISCGGTGDKSSNDNSPSNVESVDPPVVTTLSPSSGSYGTEIVIRGESLDGPRLLFAGEQADEPYQVFPHHRSPTELRTHIPFPIAGAGELFFCSSAVPASGDEDCGSDGRVDVGTFTVDSEWVPGDGHEIVREINGFADRRAVLDAYVSRDGIVAILSGWAEREEPESHPRLVVFHREAAEATGIPLQGVPLLGLGSHANVHLLEAPEGGRPEAIAQDSTGTLHYRWVEDALEPVEVDLPGRLLTASSDEAGPYVWSTVLGGIARHRVDDEWQLDREITGLASYDGWALHTADVAPDGTIAVGAIEEAGGTIDGWRYAVGASVLPPGADSFNGFERVSEFDSRGPRGGSDRYVDIAVDVGAGGSTLLSYCSPSDDDGRVNCVKPLQRDDNGDWAPVDADVLAAGPDGLVTAVSEDGDVRLTGTELPTLQLGDVLPHSLLFAPDGELRPLVVSSHDLRLYAPHRSKP